MGNRQSQVEEVWTENPWIMVEILNRYKDFPLEIESEVAKKEKMRLSMDPSAIVIKQTKPYHGELAI